MNKDLHIIKKKYGENMSRLCRELFPLLLETEELLPNLLLKHFEPSHQLYNDLIEYDLIDSFKDYIYDLVDNKEDRVDTDKTPQELLDEAGYILYECTTEEEIQSFKKYYAKNEALCTFNGGRLNRCRVFFAVKKDVDQIRREDFDNPKREDQYGTSVISIQFTRGKTNTLSIKNRYNHRVKNPDATFSNNLDNIIQGLTKSFEKQYGLVQQNRNTDFEIPSYVSIDGKYYKYNCEIENIYYCPNNIIIDNFEVKRLEKEKYVVLDYFVLNLQNKVISLYDRCLQDSFAKSIGEIEKIEVINIEEGKEINITPKEGEIVKIILDQDNNIVKLVNNNVKKIEKCFLTYNSTLKEAELSNVEIIGDWFLDNNIDLKRLYAPRLKKIGDVFLYTNLCLTDLELGSVEEIGENFLYWNNSLIRFWAPKLRKVGTHFLSQNEVLKEVDLKSLEEVGDEFLFSNISLQELELENLKIVDNDFLNNNNSLRKLYAPNLKKVGLCFLCCNNLLKVLYLPYLETAGDFFLYRNTELIELYVPNLTSKGSYFLASNPNFKNGIMKTKTLNHDHINNGIIN